MRIFTVKSLFSMLPFLSKIKSKKASNKTNSKLAANQLHLFSSFTDNNSVCLLRKCHKSKLKITKNLPDYSLELTKHPQDQWIAWGPVFVSLCFPRLWYCFFHTHTQWVWHMILGPPDRKANAISVVIRLCMLVPLSFTLILTQMLVLIHPFPPSFPKK